MDTPANTCLCNAGGGAVERITLDLRTLPPPEPMQHALAAADRLKPGQVLEVLTPLMPMPLLTALAERGLEAKATSLSEGGAKVVIRCIPTGTTAGHDPTGA
jgi:uncharacterized protein (DUF2249 family)